jgi:hypothetical protein
MQGWRHNAASAAFTAARQVEKGGVTMEVKLMQLAQDLAQLGAEALFYGQRAAGPALDSFLEKQREVMRTADKIERELASEIRFNPTRLIGIEYPLEEELDSITNLLAGLEDIKESAVHSLEDLPAKTRLFAKRLEDHLAEGVMP